MSPKVKPSQDLTVTIPLLTSKNYYTWIPMVRALLRRAGLWKYTQEQYPEGEKGKEPESEEAKKDWIQKTTEAADAIVPTLSQEIMLRLHAEDFDDGYLMWNHIREVCQPSGESE